MLNRFASALQEWIGLFRHSSNSAVVLSSKASAGNSSSYRIVPAPRQVTQDHSSLWLRPGDANRPVSEIARAQCEVVDTMLKAMIIACGENVGVPQLMPEDANRAGAGNERPGRGSLARNAGTTPVLASPLGCDCGPLQS
jgi:hypothetical protein